MPRSLLVCVVFGFLCAANTGHSAVTASKGDIAETAIFQAFLACDATFFKALSQYGAEVAALRPLAKYGANHTRIAVPDRTNPEGQTLSLAPPFRIKGIDFNEFVDEINQFDTKSETAYYWGFNSDAPLSQVLPVVQGLLPKNRLLSADETIWARIDVFDRGQWRNVANHATLKGQPALLPERALIVETHEGGGTRVMCGLQAAPLPKQELQRLRPDL